MENHIQKKAQQIPLGVLYTVGERKKFTRGFNERMPANRLSK